MSADFVARGLAARLAVPSELHPRLAGVVPGETDSARKLFDAMLGLRAHGGGTLRLAAGQRYNLGLQTVALDCGSYVIPAYSGYLLVPPESGLSFDGNGASVRITGGGPGACAIAARGAILRSDVVTGPLAAGTRVYVLASSGATAGWAVGDWALWRLGDHPLDPPETGNWGYGRVTAIDAGANSLTLDRPLTRPWDGTGTNNRHLHQVRLAADQLVDRIRIVPPAGANNGSWSGLGSFFAIRPRFPETTIDGAQIGVGVQAVEQASFGRLVIENGTGTGPDSRQGVRLAEASARIAHLVTRNIANGAIILEAASELLVDYHEDISTAPTPYRTIVGAGYNSRVHVERARYVGAGGGVISHQAGDASSSITFGTMRCEYDADPLYLPTPAREIRELSLRIGGVEELYRASRAQWFTRRLVLGDGFRSLAFPSGAVAAAQIYCGGGAVRADFQQCFVGHNYGGNSVVPLLPATPSIAPVDIFAAAFQGFGAGAPQNWTGRNQRVTAGVQTTGLAGSGKFVVLNLLIVPNDFGPAADWASDDDVVGWSG